MPLSVIIDLSTKESTSLLSNTKFAHFADWSRSSETKIFDPVSRMFLGTYRLKIDPYQLVFLEIQGASRSSMLDIAYIVETVTSNAKRW